MQRSILVVVNLLGATDVIDTTLIVAVALEIGYQARVGARGHWALSKGK